MKKAALILLVSLLSLHTSFADWIIIQKTTTDGQDQNITIKVKADKARIDVGDQMSLISDSAVGDMMMFMHSQKMMMKMNGDSMKSLMALAGQVAGNDAPSKPVATEQTEKVGDYDTVIYTWTGKMGAGKFWVAKDFPDFKALNEMQDKMMKALGNPAAAFAPQSSDFPGMVVKSEMEMMGKKSVTLLISAKPDPVDESVFKAPDGYQEMKMPGR